MKNSLCVLRMLIYFELQKLMFKNIMFLIIFRETTPKSILMTLKSYKIYTYIYSKGFNYYHYKFLSSA